MKTRRTSNPVLRLGQGLFFGILCALLILTADGLGFFRSLERSTIDTLFRARGVLYPSPNIVIVEADDSTITRYPWPLPRSVYATLIRKLTRAGAKTIAFDVLFPTHSSSPKADADLIAATAASGRVIHAAVFNFDTDSTVSVGLEGNAHTIRPRFRITDGGVEASDTVWGSAALPELQDAAAGLGHVNAPPEDDGVLRRIPHLLRFRWGRSHVLYPSLALATASHYLGVRPDQIVARPGKIELPTSDGIREIPVDSHGRTWVDWIGPHDSFLTYSFNNVLDGSVPDSEFKDKVVFIGITAAGSFERHATPYSNVQPAVELQANALDDILMRRSLRAASGTTWLALLLIFPGLIGALTMLLNARAGGVVTLILCCALWGITFLLLAKFYVVLPAATSIVAGILTWSVCLAFQQVQGAHQLRLAEERYGLAVRGANDGLWDWDLPHQQIYFSERWKSMLGYQDNEIGWDISEWLGRIHPEDRDSVQAQLDAHIAGGVEHFESRHRMRHKDGRWIWVLSRGLRVCNADGKPSRMAGSLSDITAEVEASQQLEHNAFYDALTGLPNRALFMDVLRRSLGRANRRDASSCAVLFMDLDRFKNVNDSLGHARGDELLVNVAKRLQSCLRPGDIAARLGGDEFTVLLEEIEDVSVATRIAERIQHEISQPFLLAGHEIFSTPSIGIAISSPAYEKPEELLRDADTAMYRAKSLGRAQHAVFDEAMHARALTLLRLEADLRRALEREDFSVFYQPIVQLSNGEISGFEALVRWKHPERGMISPGEFIPLAEETGLIIPLDRLILKNACLQILEWRKLMPGRALTISVNLSSKQFVQPDLVEHVRQTLTETQFPPQLLKLEITEGVLMDNPESTAAMLHEFRELGIRLSIDDFGTGYSSLSYLHRFPLNTLKVDQSFVQRIDATGERTAMVGTIVTMARNLKMDVIAEGIETVEQMEYLRSLSCEFGQGYYFSRPLPGSDAEELLLSNKQWTPTGI